MFLEVEWAGQEFLSAGEILGMDSLEKKKPVFHKTGLSKRKRKGCHPDNPIFINLKI